MSAELALQEAIYTRLTDVLDVPVYDHVPQPVDSGDNSKFPYVAIGDDTTIQWDTDSSDGFELTITIHSWSRARGRLEVKTLMGQVWDALHRYALPVVGYRTIFVYGEFSETFVEPDGITRHGVQRFRVLLDAGELGQAIAIDSGEALVTGNNELITVNT